MTCCTCKAPLDPRTAIRGQWCGAPCYPKPRTRVDGWGRRVDLPTMAGFTFTRRAA